MDLTKNGVSRDNGNIGQREIVLLEPGLSKCTN